MLHSQMRNSMLQHRHQRALHQVRPAPLPSITAPRPIVRTSASAGSSGSDEASRKKEAQVWIAAWRERTLGAKPSSGVAAASATPAPVPAPVPAAAETNDVAEYAKLAIGIASLYFLDQAIKTAFLSVGFKFPSALGGMFGVVVLLGALGEDLAAKLSKFYAPALDWIAKWLPLFYVASLVTLPLNLKGIPFDQLTKILIILAVGMVGTLLFTAQTTVFIRELVQTPNKEVAKAKPATPFLASHSIAWGAVAAASLALCAFSPAQFGAQLAVPFNLAATLLGYLAGNAVPKAYHGILHPVVVTAVTANVSAFAYGNLMGLTYDAAQKLYYSKGVGAWGAGDVLMAFLGPVIVSFGFRIYAQRHTMQRHAPEILGATFLSSVFSFFSTAFAAKALGLSSELARALIPRSVTVALALPIATQLEAPLAITAAAVLLQGLLGANFGPGLMSAVGIKDTIARGLAAAGTAGGLGTASLTSKEPEALPFCALSYSMVGILSTLLASTPFVRAALISIVG